MLKQIQSETTSLIGEVTRESSDDDHWNGVGQTMLPQRLRKLAPFDRSGRQAIVTNDGVALAGDIGPRSSTFAVDWPGLEPIVQRFIAAIEPAEIVRGI